MSDSQQLLDKVRRDNRRVRAGWIVFGAVILGLGIASLVVGLRSLDNAQKTLAQVQQQQQQLKAAVATLERHTDDGLTSANQHLDCIALFFSTPNRLNKTLQGCDVAQQPSANVSGGTTSENSTPPPASSQSSPAPAPTPQKDGPLQKIGKSITNIINTIGRSF